MTVAFGKVEEEVRKRVLESERETVMVLKRAGLGVPEVYGPVVGEYF